MEMGPNGSVMTEKWVKKHGGRTNGLDMTFNFVGLDAQLSRINLSHIATASPDDSGDGAFAEDLLNKIAEEQYDVCMYRAAQRDTEEGTDGFWTLLSSRHFEPVAVGLRRGGAILVGAAKRKSSSC